MSVAERASIHLIDTFMNLCAIPSPSRDESACAQWVRGYVEGLGLTIREDAAGAVIPAGCGNLHVQIPATSDGGTPIFFCGHLDTVTLDDELEPVIDEAAGTITNARPAILGGDNKAAVAVMLQLARDIVEQDIDHAGIEFIFTPCEEIGLLGAKHVDVASVGATFGYVFDHANDIGKVVGEAPSQISFRAEFTGRASHSGIAPEVGRSAIRAAASAIEAMPHGRIDERTTANIGLIEGGTAVNIVPERCVLRGEVRSLDHARVSTVAEEVVAAITNAATEHGVDVDVEARQEYVAYSFQETSPVVKVATTALEAAGYQPQLIPCGGGSDANVFNNAGLPCLNMCNGMREIHTSDEFIRVEDLEGMLRVAHELVRAAKEH